MWFVTAALAAAPAPTEEAPPDPVALRELARRRTTRGAVEVGVGLGLAGAGVFVMSWDRGETGAISQEQPWLMDLRSAGGGLALLGGLTTLVVGGTDVSVGRRLRLQAAAIQPVVLEGGAGAVIGARF